MRVRPKKIGVFVEPPNTINVQNITKKGGGGLRQLFEQTFIKLLYTYPYTVSKLLEVFILSLSENIRNIRKICEMCAPIRKNGRYIKIFTFHPYIRS